MVDGCGEPSRGSHGLCNRHRLRLQRRGYIERPTLTAVERFWSHVHKGPDCWTWTAGHSSTGYGGFYPAGRASGQIGAHCYSFELANGPVPDGMMVLHRCDNPSCIRPDHLFLGSHAENMSDMAAKGRGKNQVKTRCPQGHPYDSVNTYVVPTTGYRQCRTCNRARAATRVRASRRERRQ